MLTFVERMDEEFIKILQATDAHATDFVTKWAAAGMLDLLQEIPPYILAHMLHRQTAIESGCENLIATNTTNEYLHVACMCMCIIDR